MSVFWRQAPAWAAAHAFRGRGRLSLCLRANRRPEAESVDPRGEVNLCPTCLCRGELPQSGIDVVGSSTWAEAFSALDEKGQARVRDDILMLGSGFIEVAEDGTAARVDPLRVQRRGRKWVVR